MVLACVSHAQLCLHQEHMQASVGERAAQAAQAALDCGPSDAGPEAARRAAEAGAQALQASLGLRGLGGLADVVAKLHHCVHLPLKVCSALLALDLAS